MTQVGLIGAGVIGRGWAVVFARAGYEVRLFDASSGAAASAIETLRPSLEMLAEQGEIGSVPEFLRRITVADTIEQAVADAAWVQESVTENVAIKTAVFKAIDEHAPSSTILASSCSSLPPSSIFEDVSGRARCLVAHPFNPPYAMPLVELVPSRWTSDKTLAEARRFMSSVGQVPVAVSTEIYGYIGNRLQAAVVNEAMYLVGQGVVTPEDLDACLRWGLGLRWALMGPFETMDLNASTGVAEYMAKFGSDYAAMGQHLHVSDPWPSDAIAAVTAWRRTVLPATQLPTRTAWRDRMLLRLRGLFTEEVAHSAAGGAHNA